MEEDADAGSEVSEWELRERREREEERRAEELGASLVFPDEGLRADCDGKPGQCVPPHGLRLWVGI